jgi:pimeloyl-ACP methyl ester carboxylesterase
MPLKLGARLALLLLVLSTAGCGGFFARRMAQAPNTYPAWLAPAAPVELAFSSKFLTNFPAHFVEVGPPPARLEYRVVEPADFGLEVSATNWTARGRAHFKFSFRADLPGRTNAWSGAPRGTVVLLHGYGVAQFAMSPWALRLAQDGWRCVLVDLRGHGHSTGKRIYFGARETGDLTQLLDQLARDGQLKEPVAALGESYGASLALRWKAADPRVGPVVAIAPYAVLSNAVLNICHEYARWVPKGWLKAGLRHLPAVLDVAPAQLDPATVLARQPVAALFIAGAADKVTPVADVRKLYERAAPGSGWVVVPGATHEAVTYFFAALVPPVLAWLDGPGGPLTRRQARAKRSCPRRRRGAVRGRRGFESCATGGAATSRAR